MREPVRTPARYRSVSDAGSGEYAGVRYGVLGVGDRNWSVAYQRVPTLIDDRLVARGEADNSIGLAAGAEPWIEGALATLRDESGEETAERAPAPTGYRVRELDAPDIDAALHSGTLALTVEENRPLTDEGRPGRTKRLVRLALPAGQRYRAGDQGTPGRGVSFWSEDYVGQAGDLVEVVGSGAQDQFVGAQGLELRDGVAQ